MDEALKSSSKTITGFSKLNKRGKIKWIVENFFKDPENVMHELMSYWHKNEAQQNILDGFAENTISNFPMPFSVAPNFLINGKTYCVPLVIEESSVVAAVAAAAKYWMDRGGITSTVISTVKYGQIHFYWSGKSAWLHDHLAEIRLLLIHDAADIISNMEKRGGGVGAFECKEIPELQDYFQLLISFETCNSMGANFINSCLESFSQSLELFFAEHPDLPEKEKDIDILMSILSNYTPHCIVRAEVSCAIQDLGEFPGGMQAEEFAQKFYKAIQIAKADPYRAVTHNKGIFNGVDAVVIATANDFRAVEACGHAYAARSGQYRSLSDCEIKDNRFYFSLELPLALGTVGGLTSVHPIAKRSLELLEYPDAENLMKITAATGLAQNFAAIRSLITTGIQQGHMKMHLANILNQLEANSEETKQGMAYFENHKVSYSAVRAFLLSLREIK